MSQLVYSQMLWALVLMIPSCLRSASKAAGLTSCQALSVVIALHVYSQSGHIS